MTDETKEREALLPCPFCGSGYAEVVHTHKHAWWARCDDCGAETGTGANYAEGAAIWNTRSLSSAPAWVECSKQMPEVGVPVLITLGMDDDITTASLGRESAVSALFWYACRGSGKWAKDLPKYWMPLESLRALLSQPSANQRGGE